MLNYYIFTKMEEETMKNYFKLIKNNKGSNIVFKVHSSNNIYTKYYFSTKILDKCKCSKLNNNTDKKYKKVHIHEVSSKIFDLTLQEVYFNHYNSKIDRTQYSLDTYVLIYKCLLNEFNIDSLLDEIEYKIKNLVDVLNIYDFNLLLSNGLKSIIIDNYVSRYFNRNDNNPSFIIVFLNNLEGYNLRILYEKLERKSFQDCWQMFWKLIHEGKFIKHIDYRISHKTKYTDADLDWVNQMLTNYDSNILNYKKITYLNKRLNEHKYLLKSDNFEPKLKKQKATDETINTNNIQEQKNKTNTLIDYKTNNQIILDSISIQIPEQIEQVPNSEQNKVEHLEQLEQNKVEQVPDHFEQTEAEQVPDHFEQNKVEQAESEQNKVEQPEQPEKPDHFEQILEQHETEQTEQAEAEQTERNTPSPIVQQIKSLIEQQPIINKNNIQEQKNKEFNKEDISITEINNKLIKLTNKITSLKNIIEQKEKKRKIQKITQSDENSMETEEFLKTINTD